MYLYSKLQNLKKPIRIAFIGCGKFVSMFLAQYNQLNKIILDSLIEIDIERAKKMGISDMNRKYELNEIVLGDSIFSATGITDGDIVKGINKNNTTFVSETLVTHKSSNTFEIIKDNDTII